MGRNVSVSVGLSTAALVVGAASAVLLARPSETQASSHREAPFISKNPKVDGTDFYMFQSYSADRISATDGTSAYTTIIANYIPLQDSYGGPNYFTFDPVALYEIEIENSGDAVEDITFQFQFTNALNPVSANGITLDVGGVTNSVPTVQGNISVHDNPTPITAANEATLLNVQESYTINMVKGPRRSGTVSAVTDHNTGGTSFVKPVDYIGSRTLGTASAYHEYAQTHIYSIDIPGCTTGPGRVFVGQRAEGFRVNLGLIFDLVNAPLSAITSGSRSAFNFDPTQTFAASNYGFDNTALKNISSIALEIPTACLTSDGLPPATSARPKIGGWTTASVRQARVINPNATYGVPSKEGGAWAQVSRLGMPLTNEVVIGIADKDKFNSSEPSGDAQFANYVTNPTLPQILQAIFGGASTPVFPPPSFVRSDLVTLFLTGIPGVNDTGSTAEMLRLNTKLATKPSSNGGAQTQSDLGAALCFPYATTCKNAANVAACFAPVLTNTGCDTGGFPNGRRPGDDVVDIELTAILGYFVPQVNAPSGGTVLHDGVLNTESQFDGTFPYLKDPHSGDQ